MSSLIEQIKRWVVREESLIQQTYDHLHDHAEISWEEKETTAYLCQRLDDLGIPYETFADHTGVVATWDSGEEGQTIALRADIDALWQNVGGVWKANHSCGHDAHMTMVLNCLSCLKGINFKPKGKLKLIFQPAEETGEGAKAVIKSGHVDDVDYMLGIHLRPSIEMSYSHASSGIYHGATTMMEGEIRGLQAHASRPNLGINVVDSLATIVNGVNAIKLDPTVPASVKVTHVHTEGRNYNIIPDHLQFGMDLRAQTNDAMDELIEKVRQTVARAGSANGAEVKLNIRTRMAAATPNRWMEQVVGEAITDLYGEEALVAPPVTPGGEDFHFYALERERIQTTMIGLGADLNPGLHHPEMNFNRDALLRGVEIISLATVKLFERIEKEASACLQN